MLIDELILGSRMYTLYLKVWTLIWVISLVETNKFLFEGVNVKIAGLIEVPSKLVNE